MISARLKRRANATAGRGRWYISQFHHNHGLRIKCFSGLLVLHAAQALYTCTVYSSEYRYTKTLISSIRDRPATRSYLEKNLKRTARSITYRGFAHSACTSYVVDNSSKLIETIALDALRQDRVYWNDMPIADNHFENLPPNPPTHPRLPCNQEQNHEQSTRGRNRD